MADLAELQRRTSLERMLEARQRLARPVPTEQERQASDAVNSMSFLAPVNARHAARAARGTRQSTTSISAELAQWLMVVLTGAIAASLVCVLSTATKWMLDRKLSLVRAVREEHGLAASWAVHAGCGMGLVSAAVLCVFLAPHAKGSGLPALIAYCNGCKLKGFTGKRVLAAKLVGTSFSLATGLCVGPEGPIIHMGGCVGKQLLMLLYRSASFGPRTLVTAFAHLRNDLDQVCAWHARACTPCMYAHVHPADPCMTNGLDDQRDAVALGAGAGITAAFMAPIAGTIFVVEEASSHFSLSLLWRSFTACIAALWASHWLEALLGWATPHKFAIIFDVGRAANGCTASDGITAAVFGLACISPASPLHLTCISSASRVYLGRSTARRAPPTTRRRTSPPTSGSTAPPTCSG